MSQVAINQWGIFTQPPPPNPTKHASLPTLFEGIYNVEQVNTPPPPAPDHLKIATKDDNQLVKFLTIRSASFGIYSESRKIWEFFGLIIDVPAAPRRLCVLDAKQPLQTTLSAHPYVRSSVLIIGGQKIAS